MSTAWLPENSQWINLNHSGVAVLSSGIGEAKTNRIDPRGLLIVKISNKLYLEQLLEGLSLSLERADNAPSP